MMRLLTIIAACMLATGAVAEPISPSAIRVIDGDTIAVGKIHYRLVGYDAPETLHARCPAERALGLAARDRLRQMVAGGRLDLTEVPCACPPKTMGTPRCNYGRLCATLRSRGRNVGTILITEGLAHPYDYAHHRAKAPGWCGR